MAIAALSIFGAKLKIALTGVRSRVREYLKNEIFHAPKGWTFMRLAWIYHNDRFKTLLVLVPLTSFSRS